MPLQQKIEALLIEAGVAGDSDMIDTCLLALQGDASALAECAEVIEEAAAECAYAHKKECA
tara:strand:+ start:367 stop:549 length:183 start_codon:yes stop_codon:yes gene_type:complete